MGCYQLGGHGWGDYEKRDAVYAVEKAIELGVTFFDTADVYGLGRSERELGQIIARRKDKVIVATKGGVAWDAQNRTRRDNSPEYLRYAVEQSLQRLGLEAIDLYFLHWIDGKTPLTESVGSLFSLQKEGKIQRVGLSNVNGEDLTKASKLGHISAVQVKVNILHHKPVHELVKICKETQTTLVTWGSLADGLLTGKYDAHSTFGDNDHRSKALDFRGIRYLKNLQVIEQLRPIAQAHHATVAQLALRWILDMFAGSVTLFGAKTAHQVMDNLMSDTWLLSKEEVNYIAALTAE
jgi:aryl-alcohol dehydrogenase-like predicted oxidoreductase